MRVHELKTGTTYFRDVEAGLKLFEVRRNDRGFEIGDILHLRECENEVYGGNELWARVTYILPGRSEFGLDPGFVVLGIELVGPPEFPPLEVGRRSSFVCGHCGRCSHCGARSGEEHTSGCPEA